MKQLSSIILAISTILLLNGCNKDDKVEVIECGKNLSFFGDHFDPDNYISIVVALAAQDECDVTVDEFLVNGADVFNSATLLYSAIAYSYGYEDIPIGQNHKTIMRTTPSSITMSGGINNFPHDGIVDTQRPDSVQVMCDTLTNSDKKRDYVSGGHLHDISNMLKETEYCNGKALIAEKVDRLIMTNGRVDGKPEMNFSEGIYHKSTASEATEYVFANMPENVEVLVLSVYNFEKRRIGDEYKGTGHVMDFLYSHKIYGTYGDHAFGDAAGYLYAIYGLSINGQQYLQKKESCFTVNPKHGAVTANAPCGKNHFTLEPYGESEDIMRDKIVELISKNIKDTL